MRDARRLRFEWLRGTPWSAGIALGSWIYLEEKFLIVILVPANHAVEREFPFHALSCPQSHARSQVVILKKADQLLGERCGIAGRNEKAGFSIFNDFGVSPYPGRNHREACAHVFKDGVGKTLRH